MTRAYKEVEETYTKRELYSVECDWCGKKPEPEREGYFTRDWALEYTTGNTYPSGGYEEGWQVEDLCDACVEKLRALLVDAGLNVTKVAVDW